MWLMLSGVADEVGEENLGVMVDFFHANIEDVSVPDAIRRAERRLMLIHLADSNRQMPGDGTYRLHQRDQGTRRRSDLGAISPWIACPRDPTPTPI